MEISIDLARMAPEGFSALGVGVAVLISELRARSCARQKQEKDEFKQGQQQLLLAEASMRLQKLEELAALQLIPATNAIPNLGQQITILAQQLTALAQDVSELGNEAVDLRDRGRNTGSQINALIQAMEELQSQGVPDLQREFMARQRTGGMES